MMQTRNQCVLLPRHIIVCHLLTRGQLSLSLPRSLSFSRVLQPSRSVPSKKALSAQYQPNRSEKPTRGGDSDTPIVRRHSIGVFPTNVPKTTDVKASTLSRWKSSRVSNGLRRAFTINVRGKSKRVENKKEDGTEVKVVEVDCGSSFDLSAIVDSARQCSDSQEVADFLQSPVARDESSWRRIDVKRRSIASIIDLSSTDWDAGRFYIGDIASEEIYREEREPSVDRAEAEASCGFFGTYDGSRTGGHRERWRLPDILEAEEDQDHVENTPLVKVPERSPLRDSYHMPARTLAHPRATYTADDTLTMLPTTPSLASQTDLNTHPDTTTNKRSGRLFFEDIESGWTGSFLEHDSAWTKMDAAPGTPPCGYSRERHDSGSMGQPL